MPDPALDPWREADLLVSGVVGLGGDVLHERRTLDDVRHTIDYHLAKIFTAPRAAARARKTEGSPR